MIKSQSKAKTKKKREAMTTSASAAAATTPVKIKEKLNIAYYYLLMKLFSSLAIARWFAFMGKAISRIQYFSYMIMCITFVRICEYVMVCVLCEWALEIRICSDSLYLIQSMRKIVLLNGQWFASRNRNNILICNGNDANTNSLYTSNNVSTQSN